ncbi:hypothetical protein ACS0TY_016380 [Phlomoides rotata]
MASEITEDEDQNPFFIQDKEAEKIKIRKIIDYQKSLYSSSSSSSSFSSSTCSSKNNKLFDLMREGSTSLRRLFDMEHTSLANHFNDYSLSPIIKPILLWGSGTDDDEAHDDPWSRITRSRIGDGDDERVVSSQKNCKNEKLEQHWDGEKTRQRKLTRTKSYKRLPRFSLWRCGRFKFKLKLIRKLRVIIRGRIF